jgi:hypothetical protein
MGKKIKMRIQDEHPGSYFRELRNNFWVKILKYFDADADPGSGIFLPWIRYGIQDGKIRIRTSWIRQPLKISS